SGLNGMAAQLSGSADVFGTLNNTTNIAQSVTYSVTPSTLYSVGGSCVGAPFSVVVTVNPIVIISGITQVVCSGGSISLVPGSSNGTVPSGTNYTLIGASGTAAASQLTWTSFAASSSAITGNFTNTTNSVQSVTFTVQPVLASGCNTSSNFTVVITVNPRPAITNMTTVICEGVMFLVTPIDATNGVIPAGTTYSWSVPSYNASLTGGMSGNGASTITGTLQNLSNTVQTATYLIVPTSTSAQGTCAGATFTILVGVLPNAEINSITATVCSGGMINLVPSAAGNIIPASTTYTLVSASGTVGSSQLTWTSFAGSSSIVGTFTNTTNSAQSVTYIVQPILTNGCSNSSNFTVVITVNPLPAITNIAAITCEGVLFQITPVQTTNGTVPAGTLYSWSVPTYNSSITGGASGSGLNTISGNLQNLSDSVQTATYLVVPSNPTSLGSCVGATFTVTVGVNPMAHIASFTATTCANVTFSVTPTASNIIPAGTTYSWSAPSGNGFINGVAASNQPTITGNLLNTVNDIRTATYIVTPLSGNCYGAQFSVIVTLTPIPVITAMSSVICSGANFSLTPINGTNGTVPVGTTYSWSAPVVTGTMTGGDSGSGQNSIYGRLLNRTNIIQTATYSVVPNTISCGNSASFTVVIAVNPTPEVVALSTVICSGASFVLNLTNILNGIVPADTRFTWGIPTGLNIGSGQAANNQTTINGTLTNGVNELRTATYLVTPTSGLCNGAQFSVTVHVNPTPFITSISTTVCTGTQFNITPVTGGSNIIPTGTVYGWSAPALQNASLTGGVASSFSSTNVFGNISNPTNSTYFAAYTVRPATNLCSGTTFTVLAYIDPKPVITAMSTTLCNGSFTVTPVPATNGINGTVPVNTIYSWGSPSVSDVLLTGGQNGSGTTSITGNLNNATSVTQTATYLITPSFGACSGLTQSGNAFTLTVFVNPAPNISNTINRTICTGTSFVLTPTSGDGFIPTGTTYTWDTPSYSSASITGGSSRTVASSNIFDGILTNTSNSAQTVTYRVTPRVGNCNGAAFTVTITVDPKPVINAMSTVVCSGVQFAVIPVNITNGIVPTDTRYSWGLPGGINLSNGQTDSNQISIYGTLSNSVNEQRTATYVVTPIFGACNGGSAGSPFTLTVFVNPKPFIVNLNTTVCTGTSFTVTPTITGSNIIPQGTLYTWGTPAPQNASLTGGNASTFSSTNIFGTINNPTNTKYYVRYTVTPATSLCVGSNFILDVNIDPNPVISAMSTVICNGVFAVTPTNGINGTVPSNTTFNWGSPSVTDILLTGGLAGNSTRSITGSLVNGTTVAQTATYVVTPSFGTCTGSQFTITVRVNPTPSIGNDYTIVCTGSPFSVTPTNGSGNVIPTGTLYTWGTPSPQNASLTGGVASTFSSTNVFGTISNPTSTRYYVRYTVTPSINSCVGQNFIVDAYIDPKPTINAMSTVICNGLQFVINPVDVTNGIVPNDNRYAWSAPSGINIGNGQAASNQTSINGILTNSINVQRTATYLVTPTYGACTGSQFTVTVFVNPAPAIGTIYRTICTGTSFAFTLINGTDGFIPDGTLYTWDAPIFSNASLTGGSSRTIASSNIFDGALTNPTATEYTASYRVYPKFGNCLGAAFTLVITIDPKPAITQMSSVVCSGAQFILLPVNGTNGTVPANTRYSWNAPTGINIGNGQAASDQTTINGTLTNDVNVQRSATYLVTPSNGTCSGLTQSGNQFTVTVFIDPTPAVNTIYTTICSGTSFALTPTNVTDGFVPANVTYTWDAPTYSNASMSGGLSRSTASTNIFDVIINNPTSSQQTASYKVTPRVGSCQGLSFNVIVRVDPRPSVTAMSSTVCSGTSFAVNPANGMNGTVPADTRYSWAAPTGINIGNGQGASNQTTINGNLSNSVNALRTATYLVTATYAGCAGNQFTVTINVNPAPAVSNLNTTVCSGIQFMVTPTASGNNIIPAGTMYTWSIPTVENASLSGGIASTMSSTNIFGTINNPTGTRYYTRYTVTPSTSLCIGANFIVDAYIDPRPVINPMSTVICSGVGFVLSPTNLINGVVPANTLYSWNAPTGSDIGNALAASNQNTINGNLTNGVTDARTATYLVTPTLGDCTGNQFSVTVFVNPAPSISTIYRTVCTGTTFVITPTTGTDGYVPTGTTYTWSTPTYSNPSVTGGNSNSTPSSNIFDGPINNPSGLEYTASYLVVPRVGNCQGSAFNLVVSVGPKPQISAMSTVICSGSTFEISPVNVINGIVPSGTRYNWSIPTGSNIGNGQVGNNQPSVVGTLTNGVNDPRTATYLVTPTLSGCSGNQFTVTVLINPSPSINTIYRTICSGTSFSLTPTNGIDGFVPSGISYTWNTPIYSSSSVSGGQSRTSATSFIFDGPLNNSTNIVQTASYRVSPILSGNCGGAGFTVVVSINPKPIITAMTTVVCSGTSFALNPQNNINGIVPTDTRYAWNIPTGNNISNGQVGTDQLNINGTLNNTNNQQSSATYLVTPSVGGCTGSQFTVTVTVNAAPIISSLNTSVCSGSPFNISPTTSTPGNIIPVGTLYTWGMPIYESASLSGGVPSSFSTTSVTGTLTHFSTTAIDAYYTIIPATNLCVGSAFTLTLRVAPKPTIAPMSSVVCNGSFFEIIPADVVNGNILPANTSYSWGVPTGKDIVNGQSVSGQPSINGLLSVAVNAMRTATYLVTPSIIGCSGKQFTVTVFVNVAPIINSMNQVICTGASFAITPTDVTDGYIPTGTQYTWSAPIYSNASMSGGVSRNTPSSSLFGGPIVNPTSDVQTALYQVTPIGSGNCQGSTFNLLISLDPKPVIAAMSTVTSSGVQFEVSPVNGINGIVPVDTRYSWGLPTGQNIGNGQAASNQSSINGTLSNAVTVQRTATYMVTPSSGICTGNQFTVTVFINPNATINTINRIICSGTSFVVTPTSGVDGFIPDGTTYTWDAPIYSSASVSGGVSRSTASNFLFGGPLFNPTNVKQYAYYRVTPKVGSYVSSAFTLVIRIDPSPLITAMSTVVCSGSQFVVNPVQGTNGTIPDGTLYTWTTPTGTDITNGQPASDQPTIIGVLNNATNVQRTATYRVTPTFGVCSANSFTLTVFVNPAPSVANLNTIVCSGTTFALTPSSLGNLIPAGTLYSWGTPTMENASLTGGVSSTFSSTYIFGTISNPTNNRYYARYTVTPATNLCTGQNFIVDVYVDPKPVINAMSGIVCSGIQFDINPINLVNGVVPDNTRYSWNVPSGVNIGNGQAGSDQATINGTLTNSGNVQRSATYLVTPVAEGCVGSQFTVTVFLNPAPVINTINRTICTGTTFAVTPVNGIDGFISEGVVYTWDAPVYGNASMSGGQSRSIPSSNIFGGPIFNPTSSEFSAFYRVVPRIGLCVGSSFTVVITVEAKPAIKAMSSVVCTGLQFTINPTDGTNGTVPIDTRYSWSAPTGANIGNGQAASDQLSVNGTLTNETNFQRFATYIVTPSNGSCSGLTLSGNPFTVTVTVNPAPAINTINRTICSGTSFSLTPTDGVDGFVPPGTKYSWSMPIYSHASLSGGTSRTTPTNYLFGGPLSNPTNDLQTVSYLVTTDPQSSCGGTTFSLVITVIPLPQVYAMSTVVCSGNQFVVNPTNGINGTIPNDTRYSWGIPTGDNIGNGQSASNQTSINGVLTNALNVQRTATYLVTPTWYNCVGNSFTVTVFINSLPAINSISRWICSGTTFAVTPTNVTDGYAPSGTTYTWNTPVYGHPSMTGGASRSIASTNIFGGPLSNPTNRDYTAIYTVVPKSGECIGANFSVVVMVYARPVINAMSTVVCSGSQFVVIPVNGVNGTVPSDIRYSWSSPTGADIGGGQGATDQTTINGTLTVSVNAQRSATYLVTPSYAGCIGNQFTVTVFINPLPAINTITGRYCTGTNITISPSNGPDGYVPVNTNYTWNTPTLSSASLTGGVSNNIGSSSINLGTLTHNTSVNQYATYSVIPKVGNCVGTTFTIIVTVDPKPTISPMSASTCNGAQFVVSPSNVTNGIVPGGTRYAWGVPTGANIGNGTSATDQPFIIGALTNDLNAVRTATLLVTPSYGTCTGNQFSLTVFVYPLPSINTINRVICTGTSFTLTPVNGVDGFVPVQTTYTWLAPIYTNASLSGGISRTVATPNIFGGPLFNPTSSRESAAYYRVVPVGEGNCPGIPFTVVIDVDPLPTINAMTTIVCSGSQFVVTPLDKVNGIVPPDTRYTWSIPTGNDIGNGQSASSQSTINGSLTNGTNFLRTATYSVTPSLSTCTGSAFTLIVDVIPLPAINTINRTICTGTSFTVSPTDGIDGYVPLGTTYQWDMPIYSSPSLTGGASGNTPSTTIFGGPITNPTNTAQTLVYRIIPTGGIGNCGGGGSSFTLVILVNPIPVINPMSTSICSGSQFVVSPSNGINGIVPSNTRYAWGLPTGINFINGQSETDQPTVNGSLTNSVNSLRTATYLVTPSFENCTGNQFTVTVFINPTPSINTINRVVCSGSTFEATPTN
ncbi:MAG: hypothetical protein EBX50_08635, partial [Chitinophagia bacterium]|nr:hypothetical protein [Chitinophagia bacterium]